MKLILSLLILLTSSLAFGQVPSFKGQSDTTKIYPVNITTPNHQVTKTNSSTVLIETGNKNRLINPSFETSGNDLLLGWDISCTGAVYGTDVIYKSDSPVKALEGRQSLKLDVVGTTGGSCTFFQDTPTQSVDGIAQIYVYSTSASGVKAVKRVDDATALELDVTGKSEWQLMKFPGALGSTETGVGVTVTVGASESKTLYLDEAKVAIEDVKQVVGNDTDWTEFTTIWGGVATNPSIGNGSFKAKYKRSGPNIDVEINIKMGSTTTYGSGNWYFFLPNSLKPAIDQNKEFSFGRGNVLDASAGSMMMPLDVIVFSDGSFRPRSQMVTGQNFVSSAAPITFAENDIISFQFSVPIVGWSATTEVYSAEADFFSTDTNTLTFKATAITDSDPVGTFNTYSYAINSNTKTICGTAPTQTIADMKANGILIYTRAFNAASTCGNPARVEVKLGKGMATVVPSLYKNTGKSIAGNLDWTISDLTVEVGVRIKEYDGNTGVYSLDAALRGDDVTNAFLGFSDTNYQTSGYLVINAQPKKTTAVADFKEVVKSQGATGQVDIQSVYFGSGADCATACTTGTCTICNQVGSKITSVTAPSSGVFRINGIDGTKYNCTGNSFNSSTGATAVFHNRPSSLSTYAQLQPLGGASSHNSVTCIGQP